jgi:hypothetical protein
LIALITISMFFSLGQPWGTVNDVASLVQWLAAIPLVIALWSYQRGLGPVSFAVAAVGLTSLVIACGLTILLLARTVTFASVGMPTAVAGGVYGVWLLLAAAVLAGRSPLPTPLIAIMALAGIGTAIGVIGFVAFGSNHWLTYAGGLVGGLMYPVWAYWLAYLLTRTPNLLMPPAAG